MHRMQSVRPRRRKTRRRQYKDHNFISAKLPTTARKLRKIAAAKNIEAKIRSYTAEDRKAMSDQMQELIAAAQELKALIDAVK